MRDVEMDQFNAKISCDEQRGTVRTHVSGAASGRRSIPMLYITRFFALSERRAS